MRFAKAGLAGVALGASALALVAATGGARAAGDMVLTMGAGDIWKTGRRLLERL